MWSAAAQRLPLWAVLLSCTTILSGHLFHAKELSFGHHTAHRQAAPVICAYLALVSLIVADEQVLRDSFRSLHCHQTCKINEGKSC